MIFYSSEIALCYNNKLVRKKFFIKYCVKNLSFSNYRYIFAKQKCDGEIAQLVRAHDS